MRKHYLFSMHLKSEQFISCEAKLDCEKSHGGEGTPFRNIHHTIRAILLMACTILRGLILRKNVDGEYSKQLQGKKVARAGSLFSPIGSGAHTAGGEV